MDLGYSQITGYVMVGRAISTIPRTEQNGFQPEFRRANGDRARTVTASNEIER